MDPIILYIDPGTGSMLFTVLLGVLSVAFFFFQKLLLRIKQFFRGGRAVRSTSEERIPYLIYTDSGRYWNLFRPICDEFEKRGIPLVYWTSGSDDPAFSAEYSHVKREYIGDINRAVTRLNVMKTGICLSSTPGLQVYQWKRSRNTWWYAHLFHNVGAGTGYRMFGIDFYDAILLASDNQTQTLREFEQMRELPARELPVVGLPYLDEMKKRLETETEPEHTKITVLLAPTWGDSGILKKYGEQIIDSLLKTGYRIIIRPHPQSFQSEKEMIEPLLQKYPDSENLCWNRDNDNFCVLRQADILISDYSGVIWDYTMIFDRPVICADTDYDSAPYDAAWLTEKTWIFRSLPLVSIPLRKEDLPRMKEVIDQALSSEALAAGRAKTREEGWQCIGESAEKIVDYLTRKYDELKGQQTEEQSE